MTLLQLSLHPDQKRAVLDDPSPSIDAFAEGVRQGVLLLWASANRDEREFERADQFDIDRRCERSLLVEPRRSSL